MYSTSHDTCLLSLYVKTHGEQLFRLTTIIRLSSGEWLDLHSLWWRHNKPDGVPNHRRFDCLLNRLFRHRSKKRQSSASLTFAGGIHRWQVDYPQKDSVTRKMSPFDDAIMSTVFRLTTILSLPSGEWLDSHRKGLVKRNAFPCNVVIVLQKRLSQQRKRWRYQDFYRNR